MSSRCKGSNSAGLECGLNICIYKLLDDADSAGPATSEEIGKEQKRLNNEEFYKPWGKEFRFQLKSNTK